MTDEERRERRTVDGGCRGARTPEDLHGGRPTARRAALVEVARALFAPACRVARR